MNIDWNAIIKSKWFRPALAVVLFVAVAIDVTLTAKKEEPSASKIEKAYDNDDSFSIEPTIFKVSPDKVEVAGPLHSYFEVVEREYKVVNNNIKVELKRIAEGLPEPWNDGLEMGYSDGRFEPGFSIELLDADSDIECNGKTSVITDYDDIERLLSLNVGETSTVRFYVYPIAPVKFRIGSSFIVHPKESEPPVVETTSTSESSENSKYSESSENSDYSESSDYSENTDYSESSENSESSKFSENSDDSDDDYEYTDDYDPETASTWEKVKHKSKKVYQKSKKATKKTYKKAKQKVRDWLNEE